LHTPPADDIVALAQRAETYIGDIGASLSGGQKQRLLLARAPYRRPKSLMLDEATSHLDVRREAEINSALRLLDITCIVVAHRQETIAAADRVITLENDIIVSARIVRRKITPATPVSVALSKTLDP
jgi:ATP-binding cassette subfamily B protein RaxB